MSTAGFTRDRSLARPRWLIARTNHQSSARRDAGPLGGDQLADSSSGGASPRVGTDRRDLPAAGEGNGSYTSISLTATRCLAMQRGQTSIVRYFARGRNENPHTGQHNKLIAQTRYPSRASR